MHESIPNARFPKLCLDYLQLNINIGLRQNNKTVTPTLIEATSHESNYTPLSVRINKTTRRLTINILTTILLSLNAILNLVLLLTSSRSWLEICLGHFKVVDRVESHPAFQPLLLDFKTLDSNPQLFQLDPRVFEFQITTLLFSIKFWTRSRRWLMAAARGLMRGNTSICWNFVSAPRSFICLLATDHLGIHGGSLGVVNGTQFLRGKIFCEPLG